MTEILHSNVIDKQVTHTNPQFAENPLSSWVDYWTVSLLVACAGCGEGIQRGDGMIKTADLPNNKFNQLKTGDEYFKAIYCQTCKDVLEQCEADDELTALAEELKDPKKLAAAIMQVQKKAEKGHSHHYD